jgi:isoquinoline 1-oxidoreductase beta subunit
MTTADTTPFDFIDELIRTPLSRRQFIGASAGALVVAFGLGSSVKAATLPPTGGNPTGKALGGYVMVGADGTVTVLYGGAEMGQGGSTGLAQAVAEELGAKWSDVTIQSAPVGGAWETGAPWITGGSSGIRAHIDDMRLAGAQAREMLKAAAAQTWSLADASTLTAADSTVRNPATGSTLSFATLAPLAATLPIPASPPILRPGTFVGVSMPRVDIPAKTNGTAVYGIDVDAKVDPGLAGMSFAVVRNSPVLGGTLKSTPAIPPGATAVVNLGNACAVVASNTWAAIQAAAQLQASWNNPPDAASNTSSALLSTAQTLMTSGTPLTADGDPAAAAAAVGATPTLDQTYFVPYLAHVPMEVPNATVKPTYVAGTLTQLDIWIPTQAPAWVQGFAASLCPAGTVINVHTTLLGGGFGRKIEMDYAIQAVKTALALRKAVKVTWTREEDVSHDQYRPMALSRVRAKLDASGNITGWLNRTVTQSILAPRNWIGPGQLDSTAVECATIGTGVPYVGASPTHAVEWVRHPATVWVGFWRSVGASINTFVVESAIDELAAAAAAAAGTPVDEYRFRRKLLQASPDPRAARFLYALDQAALLGGWDTPLPAGRARGISLSTCFDSIVAEMVEVSAPVAGSLTVHKVAVALDCGVVVNPNAVEAQVQGGVSYALSAALWDQITFTGGKADQKNFNNYRMLRAREMPVVSTKIITTSGVATGGVGEVAVPGIASAVVTAYAKASKLPRVRSLPIFPGSKMGG